MQKKWLKGFAPLGKRVSPLMSCSADTNGKTLIFSKRAHMGWDEVLSELLKLYRKFSEIKSKSAR